MPGLDRDAAVQRSWALLRALATDDERRAAVADALEMSFARTKVLRRLLDGALSLRELADILRADPPYLTVMIDDLEARGLVERIPHPHDGRAKLARLTPAGRRAARRAAAIADEPPVGLAALPGDDLAALARILERIAAG